MLRISALFIDKMAVLGRSWPTIWHWFLGCLLMNQSSLAQKGIEGGEHYWDAEMQFTDEYMLNAQGVTFPRYFVCSKTQEIVLQEVLTEQGTTQNRSDHHLSHSKWSVYVQDYLFYNELQLESDEEMVKFNEELDNDIHFNVFRYGIQLFLFIVLVFYCISMLIHVSLGYCMGRFMMWALPRLHPPIKVIGRALVVNFVLMIRSRIQYFGREAYAEIYRDVFFRVPHFFRDHTSESEPEILRNMLTTSERREVYVNDIYAQYSDTSVELNPKTMRLRELYIRFRKAQFRQAARDQEAERLRDVARQEAIARKRAARVAETARLKEAARLKEITEAEAKLKFEYVDETKGRGGTKKLRKKVGPSKSKSTTPSSQHREKMKWLTKDKSNTSSERSRTPRTKKPPPSKVKTTASTGSKTPKKLKTPKWMEMP